MVHHFTREKHAKNDTRMRKLVIPAQKERKSQKFLEVSRLKDIHHTLLQVSLTTMMMTIGIISTLDSCMLPVMTSNCDISQTVRNLASRQKTKLVHWFRFILRRGQRVDPGWPKLTFDYWLKTLKGVKRQSFWGWPRVGRVLTRRLTRVYQKLTFAQKSGMSKQV